MSGDPGSEVARVTGFTRRWISELLRRWNEAGLAGLGDRRSGNAGAQPMLDDVGLAALVEALEGSPADGGLWNGRQVAAWMSAYLGRKVSPKRGLDYLHRLGFSRQRPRPRHARAAGPEGRAAFKKTPPRSGGGAAPGARASDRGLGLRRAPPRPEADHPPGLGKGRRATACRQQSQVRMALPLRLRSAGQRRG